MHATVSKELITLRMCWRKWRAVVEQFASQRSSRHRVDAAAYHLLHDNVIEACRQAELSESEATRRTQLHDAEELSLPWMTLETLKRADQGILLNLATRCRMTENMLGGGTGSWVGSIATVVVFTIVLGVVGGVLSAGSVSDALTTGNTGLESLRQVVSLWWFRISIGEIAALYWVVGIAIGIITLAGAYAVFKAPKSY